MKALVTHIDLDGVSCSVIARYLGEEFDKMWFINYDKLEDETIRDEVCEYDEVLITDLCIPLDWYEAIKENVSKYTILDHHEGTAEYENDENVIYGPGTSGTKLVYQHFKGKRIPSIVREFVDLVDTYDMWKIDSPLWKNAKKLHNLMFRTRFWGVEGYEKYKRFITDQTLKFRYLNSFIFTKHEKLLIKAAEDKEVEQYHTSVAEIQRRRDRHGRTFGLVEASSSVSYVLNRILDEEPSMDYIVSINTYDRSTGGLSARSQREGLNLNTDVYPFEGHEHSAGMHLDTEFIEGLWSGLYRSTEEYGEFLQTNVQDG